MTQALALSTQRSVGSPADWLPLAEVARRTGLSERTWRFRCEGDLAKRGLARKQSAPSGKARSAWYVHVAADPRLVENSEPGTRNSELGVPDLSGYAAHHVANAQRRLYWLKRWHELCDTHPDIPKRNLAERVIAEAAEGNEATRQQGNKAPNRDREGAATLDLGPWTLGPVPGTRNSELRTRLSLRSLQTWDAAYRRHGLVGLIDRYGAGTAARVGTGDPTPARSPEAIAYFYDLFRTQAKRKVALCHDMTVDQAGRRGWKWPRSYSATVRWLRDYDDIALSYLLRFGPTQWGHRYKDFVEQDYRAIGAGNQYVLDHHQLNCWVRWRGKQVRPWITAVLDQRTRVLVGWHLSAAANTDTILAALHRAFVDYGVPRRVRIDNGKDYTAQALVGLTKRQRSELRKTLGPNWLQRWREKVTVGATAWAGVFSELGIQVVYTPPYQPQAKNVERFFNTLDERFTKNVATYCGKSPDDRPECLAQVKADGSAVPLLEDLAVEQFPRFLDWYHRDHAHGGDGMGAMTPLQAWHAAPGEARTVLDSALACLIGIRGDYKVVKNGVRVQIGSQSFSYGRGELQRWKGRSVLVGLDPCMPGRAYIYDPKDRRLLCTVASNKRIAPDATMEDLREAVAEVQRARKEERRAKASAATRMKSAARLASEAAARRHADRLRATGTDDATPDSGPGSLNSELSPIRVLQTGFEAAANQVQKGAVASLSGVAFDGAADDFSEYDQPAPPSGDDDDELDEFDWDDEPKPVTDDDDEEDLLWPSMIGSRPRPTATRKRSPTS